MTDDWYRITRRWSEDKVVEYLLSSEVAWYAAHPNAYTIEPVLVMTQAEYDALVEQPDAPAIVPSEVRQAMAWALSWAKNDSREIRLHSTAMEHQAIMASIDEALAWLAALGQEATK